MPSLFLHIQEVKYIEVNKIFNEDCLEGMKRIPDKSIDMILTDPPYLINYRSNYRKQKYNYIENDKDNLNLIKKVIAECFRVLKDDTAMYMFCSWHKVDFFKREFEEKFKLKNIIIWNKNNTSMGDLKGSYAPKHEFILYGHKGRRLLEGFRYPDVIEANRTNNKLHPTEKPVELLEKFIVTSSKENDLILDPFMGSSSTAVACINTGRFFIGFEMDKNYFDIATERIEGHSMILT